MRLRVIVAVFALVLALVTPATQAAASTPDDAVADVTQTTMVTDPMGPVAAGTPLAVTVTVIISATGEPQTEGQVNLLAGEVSVGSAALSAAGTAAFTVDGSIVIAGTLNLTARFDDAGYSAGSSAETAVTVYFPDSPPTVGGSPAPFFQDIRWLAGQEVTSGFGDGGFHPTSAVSRQAMAAFLYRVANPGVAPADCATKPFPDVDVTNTFCGAITWLAAQHITAGFSDGGFHPTSAVSRQAMAQFLYRFQTGNATAPGCASAPFNDVPAGDGFCGAISWLVSRGVTTGFSDGGFHATAAVSRQAMAAFLHRLKGDAIGVLTSSARQVAAADVVSLVETGDAGYEDITLAAGVDAPGVDGFLVLPISPQYPLGVVGHVLSSTLGSGGTVILSLDPATLDDVYESLTIISSRVVNPVLETASARAGVASTAGVAAASVGSGWDCTGDLSSNLDLDVNLTGITVDFTFKTHLLRAPEMSLSVEYKPGFTVNLGAGFSGECSAQFRAATVPLSVAPPIVGEIEPYLTASLSASGSISFSAGADFRYEVHAKGGDVDDDVTMIPFQSGLDTELDSNASIQIGIKASALLGGVVGLTGDLGIRASLGGFSAENGSTCQGIQISLVLALDATLDVIVHEFSFELASLELPVKDIAIHCDPPTSDRWLGTVDETITGYQHLESTDDPDYFNQTWTYNNIRAVWKLNPNDALLKLRGTLRMQEAGNLGQYDVLLTYRHSNPAHYGQGSEWFEGRTDMIGDVSGVFPFAGATALIAGECSGGCGVPSTVWGDGDGRISQFRSFIQPWRYACTGVEAFPEGIQAIRSTVTMHCVVNPDETWPSYNNVLTYTADLTFTFDFELKSPNCDSSVDSDHDGTGDCEEFDNGGDPAR